MKHAPAAIILLLVASCALPEPPAEQAVDLMLADDLHIAFQPDTSVVAFAGWQRLDNGRTLIKRVDNPPVFEQQPKVTLEVTLRSAGDPWDKLGAVVVWPDGPEVRAALDAGRAPETPGVELLRFITPFGVGHFSNQERLDEYRPVYVPAWADSVHWQADVTPLLPLLEAPFHIALHVDTWSDAGQVADVRLRWTPSPAEVHRKQPAVVVPLMNTLKLFEDQTLFTDFASGPVTQSFTLDVPLHGARLRLATTGHGGHAEGDEFVPSEHVIDVDGQEVARFTPWRDDCASFRRLNPSSGVWTERTYWRGDSIDERIASSDYSRSGWCPGSDVEVREVDLGYLAAGPHQLTVHIPTAQPYADTAQNFFNVTAHLIGRRTP